MIEARQFLRKQTQHVHERLDEAFSRLDLTQSSDYTLFLKAHYGGLSQLLPLISPHNARPIIENRLQAIQADLSIMAETPIRQPNEMALTLPPDCAPLGVLYVVAGSHLGQKILRRRWEKSTDHKVLAAHHYFDLPETQKDWENVLSELSNLSIESKAMGKVVGGALFAFNVFRRSLDCADPEKYYENAE